MPEKCLISKTTFGKNTLDKAMTGWTTGKVGITKKTFKKKRCGPGLPTTATNYQLPTTTLNKRCSPGLPTTTIK